MSNDAMNAKHSMCQESLGLRPSEVDAIEQSGFKFMTEDSIARGHEMHIVLSRNYTTGLTGTSHSRETYVTREVLSLVAALRHAVASGDPK